MRPKENSTRRQLLARKNYGRRNLSDYLGNLSLALSQDQGTDKLVSLEETDELYQVFSEAFRLATERKLTAYRQTWPATKKDELESKLTCLTRNTAEEEVILFARGFDYSGAVRLSLHSVLTHMFEIICVDGDSVQFLAASKASGLILDSNEGEALNDETYELILWGDDWMKAIDKC